MAHITKISYLNHHTLNTTLLFLILGVENMDILENIYNTLTVILLSRTQEEELYNEPIDKSVLKIQSCFEYFNRKHTLQTLSMKVKDVVIGLNRKYHYKEGLAFVFKRFLVAYSFVSNNYFT